MAQPRKIRKHRNQFRYDGSSIGVPLETGDQQTSQVSIRGPNITIYDDEILPGPQDYKPAHITGMYSFNSTFKNSPSFSIQKVPSKKLNGVMISKEHTVDLIGKDSPGVGLYETSAD